MFTVDDSGMAWGEYRMFICDEDNNVIVEIWGTTRERAERLAELIADAMNGEEDKD